jgi:lysophospholipase L1-like esterase
VLAALQLHSRPGHQRHRRSVHRHVLLRPLAAGLAAVGLLLTGCGGSGGDGGDQRLIAALGDSITAGNPGYDPDPATRRRLGLGNNPESQWEWWAERKHPDLEFRNCGVRGERTDEIASRLEDCSSGADAVVIQGGTNDVVEGVPVRAAARNLRRMVEAARAENLDVALADVLPLNPAHPAADRPIAELNRRIEGIAAAEHVRLLPFHETLQDPDHPGLIERAWTADGIHPSVAGYRRLGELAFSPPGG